MLLLRFFLIALIVVTIAGFFVLFFTVQTIKVTFIVILELLLCFLNTMSGPKLAYLLEISLFHLINYNLTITV